MNVLSIISKRLSKPISYFLEESNSELKLTINQYTEAKDLYSQGKYQEAYELFEQLLPDLMEDKLYLYYDCLYHMARSLSAQQKQEKSLVILTRFFEDCNENTSLELQIEAMSHMGYCYSHLGREKDAILCYQKVLTLMKDHQMNHPQVKALALMNLGTSYLNLDQLVRAKSYLEEGITFCREQRLLSHLLDCYIRNSHVEFKLGNLTASEEQLKKASAMNYSLEDEMVKGDISFLQAQHEISAGAYEKAVECLNIAIDIFHKYQYLDGYYYNLILLIHLLTETGQLQAAKELITTHNDAIRNRKCPFLISLLDFEAGYRKSCECKVEAGAEEMEKAIQELIKENEIWEVYRIAKIFADRVIKEYPETAKKYYNISLDYYKKLGSMA
jgi:tetratricopeptide (TPR) repeat protein